MKKILSNTLKTGSVITAVSTFLTVAASNFASAECVSSIDSVTHQPCSKYELWNVISSGINFLLIAIGTLSVVMIIVGGIRYTTSGGNEKSVTAAKNTIMYAVIGLVVALLAGAIVNFVIGTNGIIKTV